MKEAVYLGIDVGTGSARAGLFTAKGRMLASASHPIRMWKPEADFVEQSSDDIWRACCRATRMALSKGGVSASRVKGVGLDATCSLVVLDEAGRPVTVSPTGRDAQNVIVWMDHRATGQADRINRTRHPVLKYVGGAISPEMQTPKLLWLKENLPETWGRAAAFFDLPDYLTYRATGDATRSLCSVVCKWTYLGQRGGEGQGWDAGYFRKIGLGDLADEGFGRIGTRIRPMGEALGSGLTEGSAKELGLEAGTPVGVSIIDAHAGGLGMLGASLDGKTSVEDRLALIGGTSSCHMAVSRDPKFIRGVWGPYFSAMVPGMWLAEGGQSATGALVDHVIRTHPAAKAAKARASRNKRTIYEELNARLDAMAAAEGVAHPAELTRDLHVQPDFHGNRSPRADATLKGVVAGLTLASDEDDLARLYLATIQAVAHGTRHIIDEMHKAGLGIRTVFVCGGGAKNPVFLREHADITGCELILPKEPEAVLLGAAALGAVASGKWTEVALAMAAMNAAGRRVRPSPGAVRSYHDLKHRIFHRMHADFIGYRRVMAAEK